MSGARPNGTAWPAMSMVRPTSMPASTQGRPLGEREVAAGAVLEQRIDLQVAGDDIARDAAFPSFPRDRWLNWAALLRRVFELDVRRCTSCGARMRVIAFIEMATCP